MLQLLLRCLLLVTRNIGHDEQSEMRLVLAVFMFSVLSLGLLMVPTQTNANSIVPSAMAAQ